MNLYTFQVKYNRDIENIYNIIVNTFMSKNIILEDSNKNFQRNLVIFLYKKNINLKIQRNGVHTGVVLSHGGSSLPLGNNLDGSIGVSWTNL